MTAESEHPKCPDCGLPLDTPAMEFLHRKSHAMVQCNDLYTLACVPVVLYRAVAEVMQEYADYHVAEVLAEKQDDGTGTERKHGQHQ